MSLSLTIFVSWIGLGIGNFIYAAFTKKKWGTATERTIYQGVALVILGIVLTVRG